MFIYTVRLSALKKGYLSVRGDVMKLRYWLDCKFKKKHRYSLYDGKCIVCGKQKKH